MVLAVSAAITAVIVLFYHQVALSLGMVAVGFVLSLAAAIAMRRRVRSSGDPDVESLLAPQAVCGRVTALEPLAAPFCQRPCVFFRAQYEASDEWNEIEEEVRDFLVAPLDGGASVHVRSEGIRIILSTAHRYAHRDGTNVVYIPVDDTVVVAGEATTEPHATGASEGYRHPPTRTVLKRALVTNLDVTELDRRARKPHRMIAMIAPGAFVVLAILVFLLGRAMG